MTERERRLIRQVLDYAANTLEAVNDNHPPVGWQRFAWEEHCLGRYQSADMVRGLEVEELYKQLCERED
jgi:hypothetical protein